MWNPSGAQVKVCQHPPPPTNGRRRMCPSAFGKKCQRQPGLAVQSLLTAGFEDTTCTGDNPERRNTQGFAIKAQTKARFEPGQPGMYELGVPGAQLSPSDGRGPVLVHALKVSPTPHAIRLGSPPFHLKAPWTQLVTAIDELLTTARGGH